jgi:hypothetical protein
MGALTDTSIGAAVSCGVVCALLSLWPASSPRLWSAKNRGDANAGPASCWGVSATGPGPPPEKEFHKSVLAPHHKLYMQHNIILGCSPCPSVGKWSLADMLANDNVSQKNILDVPLFSIARDVKFVQISHPKNRGNQPLSTRICH